MKKVYPLFILTLLILISFLGCKSQSENIEKDKINKQITMNIIENKKIELKETVVQINEIDKNTDLEQKDGIMVIRFILEVDKENKLMKLPNFRINGTKKFEVDNRPSTIQKDAIHVYRLPEGKYSISSLYFINEQGVYEFDKPFPNNSFLIERNKINFIGDIIVKLEEESKSKNELARKLKLKLPNDTEETLLIVKEKLKDILEKYPLEQKIITFK